MNNNLLFIVRSNVQCSSRDIARLKIFTILWRLFLRCYYYRFKVKIEHRVNIILVQSGQPSRLRWSQISFSIFLYTAGWLLSLFLIRFPPMLSRMPVCPTVTYFCEVLSFTSSKENPYMYVYLYILIQSIYWTVLYPRTKNSFPHSIHFF